MKSKPKDELRKKAIDLKAALPSSIMPWFKKKWPKYAEGKNFHRLRNTLIGNTAHKDVVDKLEVLELFVNGATAMTPIEYNGEELWVSYTEDHELTKVVWNGVDVTSLVELHSDFHYEIEQAMLKKIED